jgi:hypothetical protein
MYTDHTEQDNHVLDELQLDNVMVVSIYILIIQNKVSMCCMSCI